MGLFRKKPKGEERDKKPGLIKRLWKLIRNIDWQNPIHRWRILFIGLLTIIIVSVGSYSAIALTSTRTFCTVCHEMAPENRTMEVSAHSEIGCVDCHIGPGAVNTLVHKVKALKEVYSHIFGLPDPIVQTSAVPDKNCLQCHSENRDVTTNGDLIVAHKEHIAEQIPCVTCHSGVAHAKVVERGLNTGADYDYWTVENIDKLVSIDDMLPNMGTCIDCHDKVNNGERPWDDIAYSLPDSSHYKNKGRKKDSSSNSLEEDTITQETILQAISNQKSDNVEISMSCATCHEEIGIPTHHNKEGWVDNHSNEAWNEFKQCVNCHEDSKWMKHIPEQNIVSLIEAAASKTDNKKMSKENVNEEMKKNKFCYSCHEKRF